MRMAKSIKEISIEVVENMPYEVSFPKPYYTAASNTRYTISSRPVFLRPFLDYFDNPTFVWSVNGKVIEHAKDRQYKFTPESARRIPCQGNCNRRAKWHIC